jgi:hypothetical protein
MLAILTHRPIPAVNVRIEIAVPGPAYGKLDL